jgi:iron complex transport system permease protein
MNTKRIIRYQIVFTALLCSIAAAIVLNVNTGSVSISPLRIFKILFMRIDPGSVDSQIVWSIRLPRLLTAAVLGGALSVSGFLLQIFSAIPSRAPLCWASRPARGCAWALSSFS